MKLHKQSLLLRLRVWLIRKLIGKDITAVFNCTVTGLHTTNSHFISNVLIVEEQRTNTNLNTE